MDWEKAIVTSWSFLFVHQICFKFLRELGCYLPVNFLILSIVFEQSQATFEEQWQEHDICWC